MHQSDQNSEFDKLARSAIIWIFSMPKIFKSFCNLITPYVGYSVYNEGNNLFLRLGYARKSCYH